MVVVVDPDEFRPAGTLGGVVSGGGEDTLLTVTVVAAEVVVFPAASRATAVRVWLPLTASVVSQARLYGAAVSSAPKLAPSSLNWTPTNKLLSEALALTVVEPDTVPPSAGAVITTTGAVLSTVILAVPDVVILPALSIAVAVIAWLPSLKPVVSRLIVYGAAGCTEPKLEPSTKNCTLGTPRLSEALAPKLIVPRTTELLAGEDKEMLGGELSTVTVIVAAVVVLPTLSRATAVKLWLPLLAAVLSQLSV
jgi:hypothetical protein